MTPLQSIDLFRRPGVARSILGLLSVGFLMLIVIAVSTVVTTRRSQTFNQLVEHSLDVRRLNGEVMRLVLDAETGQRGYLVTGATDYLDVHDSALADLSGSLNRLQALVADNPSQTQKVKDLRVAVDRRIGTLERVISVARSGRREAAFDMVRTGLGRSEMKDVRIRSAAIDEKENALLIYRERQVEGADRLNLAINFISLVLIGVIAAVSIFVFVRYLREIQASRAELDRLNQGLEQTVAERTEELRTANDEIQKFAYIVSHDLRAPLVNVMGYTSEMEAASKALERQLEAVRERAPELLDAEAELAVKEDVPEAIGFIRASTAKMDRLINAILKLSRDGRRVLSAEPIDMTAMAQTLADSLNHQTGEAGAEIVVETLPPLFGDRLAIDQIFGNLLDNAVKFLDPSRPGRVVVRGRTDPLWNIYEIEDNGRGVDPKDHERVFELFRRAGTQDRPGEGLGLAFVRNSVRRMGGTIDLASTPGQGSTFTLKFPKAVAVSKDAAA